MTHSRRLYRTLAFTQSHARLTGARLLPAVEERNRPVMAKHLCMKVRISSLILLANHPPVSPRINHAGAEQFVGGHPSCNSSSIGRFRCWPGGRRVKGGFRGCPPQRPSKFLTFISSFSWSKGRGELVGSNAKNSRHSFSVKGGDIGQTTREVRECLFARTDALGEDGIQVRLVAGFWARTLDCRLRLPEWKHLSVTFPAFTPRLTAVRLFPSRIPAPNVRCAQVSRNASSVGGADSPVQVRACDEAPDGPARARRTPPQVMLMQRSAHRGVGPIQLDGTPNPSVTLWLIFATTGMDVRECLWYSPLSTQPLRKHFFPWPSHPDRPHQYRKLYSQFHLRLAHPNQSLGPSWLVRVCRFDSYEALATTHRESREDRENDEAVGILPTGARGDMGGVGGGGAATAAIAARTRRLRAKNEACMLPDRLLHRVRR